MPNENGIIDAKKMTTLTHARRKTARGRSHFSERSSMSSSPPRGGDPRLEEARRQERHDDELRDDAARDARDDGVVGREEVAMMQDATMSGRVDAPIGARAGEAQEERR